MKRFERASRSVLFGPRTLRLILIFFVYCFDICINKALLVFFLVEIRDVIHIKEQSFRCDGSFHNVGLLYSMSLECLLEFQRCNILEQAAHILCVIHFCTLF